MARWTIMLAAAGSLLSASTITFTVATPTYPVPGTGAASLVIPQFDPSFGLLTSATFTFTAVTSVTATSTNPGSVDAVFYYHSDPAVTLGIYPVSPSLPIGLWIYQPVSASLVAPPGPFSETSTPQTGSKAITISGPLDLPPYIGPGTVSLPLFVSDIGSEGLSPGPRIVGPSGSFVPGLVETNWAAHLDVTYTYTVPEPASAALVGLGLVAALGLVLRSKLRPRAS